MQLIQNSILFSHIVLGSFAVVAGAVALFSKKGKTNHILFGRGFAWFMALASLLGAMMGLINYTEYLITAFAGVLALCLIVSSLLTLKNTDQKKPYYEPTIAVVNLINFIAIITAGTIALGNPDTSLFGFQAEDYFLLGGMSAIVVIGDARYLSVLRSSMSIQRHKKIARHLWRMCLGFFIAAGSAFTGPGMAAFPVGVQESGILALPELLIFTLMLFWFFRTRYFTKTDPL